MDKTKFGEFLVQLRKEKNLTQVELASKLNLTNKTISKWETGRGLPDVSLLEPLANALDISVIELMKQERLDHQKTYTLQSFSKEIIETLDYYHQRKKESFKDSLFLLFVLFIGYALYFLTYMILVIITPYISLISILLGILILIKGIWNIQLGKNYAFEFTLSLFCLFTPLFFYLMPIF